jgi:hypothetical protein
MPVRLKFLKTDVQIYFNITKKNEMMHKMNLIFNLEMYSVTGQF